MSLKLYCGVGSRSTPRDILDLMQDIGCQFALKKWGLVTGDAHGADAAFIGGAKSVRGPYLAYVPFQRRAIVISKDPPQQYIWPSDAQSWFEAQEVLEQTGVAPDIRGMPPYIKPYVLRDVFQVLGDMPITSPVPVDCVVYWARESGIGQISGGTKYAVGVARAHNIMCHNLYFREEQARWYDWLKNGVEDGA